MITIVMAYYENPGMLRKHLEAWSYYAIHDAGLFNVVLVDDGSPRNPAIDVLRDRRLGEERMPIRLFRIDKDIPWNQDGARNLGMHHAQTGWCLLTDMDMVLEPHDASKAVDFARKYPSHVTTYWMPGRRTAQGEYKDPHPNTYLMHRTFFWLAGGYDEDFAGCYGSDGNFRKCMRAQGSERMIPHEFKLTWYGRDDIPDASTVDYGRKESQYWRPNFPHLEAKRRGPPYKASNHIRFPWHEEVL